MSRPLAGHLAPSLEYDGTWERSLATGWLDSQFLRHVGIGALPGRYVNFSV